MFRTRNIGHILMDKKLPYTFTVSEGSKSRKMIDSVRPGERPFRYTFDVLTPTGHEESLVDIDIIQMECGHTIEIENRCTWPVFVRLYRDGELVAPTE